jgi:hypothetical protein
LWPILRDAPLAAKKAQGKQLGNPKLVAAAAKRDKVLRPILQKLAGQSLRAIAAELDRRGINSWSGKPWNAVSVRNAMVRLGFQTTGARHNASPRRRGPLRRDNRRATPVRTTSAKIAACRMRIRR